MGACVHTQSIEIKLVLVGEAAELYSLKGAENNLAVIFV
jgi:hypothetical protein